MRQFLQQDEPEDVLAELVDALADSTVPIVVLAVLMTLVGGYVLSEVTSAAVLAATVAGVLSSFAKVALMLRCRRSPLAGRQPPLHEIRRRERAHLLSTLAVAASVGFFTASIFAIPQVSLHLGATSILLAYCAGVINRVSIRPRAAILALFVAGTPGMLAAAQGGSEAHLVLAAVFATSLAGAIQSVAYVYDTARRGVALRLQMAALARRDPLTSLCNRLGLREAFDALSQNDGHLVAVHAFDLDGFKSVNDRLGHAAGDRLLVILAERIRAAVGPGTIVARTGGDEFVLVQLGVRHEGEVRRLAERIHGELTRPCELDAAVVSVGLSLGYAWGRRGEIHLDDLTRRADAASYVAKRSGGGVRAHADTATPSLVPLPERSAAVA